MLKLACVAFEQLVERIDIKEEGVVWDKLHGLAGGA
jgi:hypothetical protein